MSRWSPDDDPDDDWDEGEDAWTDEDDESAVSKCPKCGADIYEDAVRCPLCGEYLTHSTSAWNGRPMWWRLLGLAGIIAVIAAIIIAAGL
jgi:predicted amidophosphoribosyltransferase